MEGEESSEEEDSASVPLLSNNFNFAPDIVARFEEGYKGNDIAARDAMRNTYVRCPAALLLYTSVIE